MFVQKYCDIVEDHFGKKKPLVVLVLVSALLGVIPLGAGVTVLIKGPEAIPAFIKTLFDEEERETASNKALSEPGRVRPDYETIPEYIPKQKSENDLARSNIDWDKLISDQGPLDIEDEQPPKPNANYQKATLMITAAGTVNSIVLGWLTLYFGLRRKGKNE